MIPYDDLVAALTSWRARQGLPVASTATAGSGPVPMAMPGTGPTPTPSSGPTASPGSGPQGYGTYQPPPLQTVDTTDDPLDVDDAALLEEQYDNEGADYAMNFSGVEQSDESTTLGQAPERDSFGGATEFDPPPSSKKPW